MLGFHGVTYLYYEKSQREPPLAVLAKTVFDCTGDILTGATFDDAVARVTFGADLHTKSNKGQNCFQVQPYQIPLRALIPQGYNGIVVAGRCISGSRETMASYRVTGNCAQMGENAGVLRCRGNQAEY